MSSITIRKSHQCGQEHLSFRPETKRILYTSIKKSIEMLEDSVARIMIVMGHTSPELDLIEHFCDRDGQPEQSDRSVNIAITESTIEEFDGLEDIKNKVSLFRD
jgi:hypothetical protein